MLRLIFGLCLCIAASSAAAKDYAETMQFQTFHPCTGTASFCGPLVLAQGVLDEGAPDRLKAYLQSVDGYPTIVFDSPGGNLIAGIQLGRLIRGWGLNTAMGLEYSEETSEGRRVVASDVVCYSACAYAFMGGLSRLLVDGAHYGVHQFYGATEDQQAVTQVTVAVLSQYMKQMGIDRDLLDVASLTASEEVTEISHDDAVGVNLDNMNPLLARWEMRPMDDGKMVVYVRQQKAGSDAVTSMGIARAPSAPSSLLIVVRSEGFYPKRSPALIPNYLPSVNEDAGLCSGAEKCVTFTTAQGWEYNAAENRLEAMYLAPLQPLVDVVTDAGRLNFIAGFPEAASDLDPSVELGRDGLRAALLALLKQSTEGNSLPDSSSEGFAPSVGSPSIGSATDAAMQITSPKSVFSPSDTIYLVVPTSAPEGHVTSGQLAVHWTYGPDAQTVYDEVKPMQFTGEQTARFSISKPDGWPVGVYRAEVMLDGELVKTVAFSVR